MLRRSWRGLSRSYALCVVSSRKPLSIDTYKAEVAEAALKEGATLINDISFLADPDMLKVAREKWRAAGHNP